MAQLVHSSKYQPRIFPINGNSPAAEIDRVQSIDPSITLNREKIEEVGRDGTVDFVKRAPSTTYDVTQNEYGNFEFWRKITNKGSSVNSVTLSDFESPYSDIVAYLTDNAGTFVGTMWYPELRVSDFSVNIGSPEDIIERNFSFVGEKASLFQDTNKYFIQGTHTVTVGEAGGSVDVDLSSQSPVVDPDNSGTYMLRVTLYDDSAGTTSVLDTSDYSFDSGTDTLSVTTTTETDDIIKAYYTSGTAPDTMFSLNDSDVGGLLADTASIYLYVPASGSPSSSDYIYRLQSASIDATLDREDLKEIGSNEVVQRGVTDQTITVDIGRIIDDFTVEEAMRGAGSNYGRLDVEEFKDNMTLIVRIFGTNDKNTLKYGFKATNLSPTDIGGTASVNAHVEQSNTLEGQELTISTENTDLGSL